MDQPTYSQTEVSLEHAFLMGQASAIVATLYHNELPPRGLTGSLDWYFKGAFSMYLQKGAISGKEGECAYCPITQNQKIYPVILIGAGVNTEPGQRVPLPASSLHLLQKNLLSLGFQKIALSRSDFGGSPTELLTQQLKGVPLWITD